MTSTIASMKESMASLPLVAVRDVKHEQLEPAQPAHELLDGGQAAGRFAELAVHGRQRRKDRCELTRHAAAVLARCSEEEFDASARIADAA